MGKKQSKRKCKQPGVCAFCGESGVTKQHVWPDWLKKIVPREGESHWQYLTSINLSYPGTAIVQPDFQQKRGPTGAMKIRNVCMQCNGGWMSKIEQDSKPIVTTLINLQEAQVDLPKQKLIAAWATLLSVMGEYTDLRTQSIPAEHRYFLKNSLQPPVGWRIWIGSYQGSQWKQRYRHHGFQCFSPTCTPAKPGFNTQFSTFVIGGLLLHIASTALPNADFNFSDPSAMGLNQIWPPQAAFSWPSFPILSDGEANEVADAFFFNALSKS